MTNYSKLNAARLRELEAKKKERWTKNPVSAFFSDWVGDGADELEEATTRTFAPNALSDEDSMDELRQKAGYKKKDQWEGLQRYLLSGN